MLFKIRKTIKGAALKKGSCHGGSNLLICFKELPALTIENHWMACYLYTAYTYIHIYAYFSFLNIYMYIYVSLSLSLCIAIYIYIYICITIYVCTYVCINKYVHLCIYIYNMFLSLLSLSLRGISIGICLSQLLCFKICI